jgi:hypothetical protein
VARSRSPLTSICRWPRRRPTSTATIRTTDEETAALLRRATPLDFPNQIITNDIKSSQAIERARGRR